MREEAMTGAASALTVELGDWARAYEDEFFRTTGRHITVFRFAKNGRFRGWFKLIEPGDYGIHNYRMCEIVRMTVALSARPSVESPNVQIEPPPRLFAEVGSNAGLGIGGPERKGK